jgi:hypothetical protein
MHKEFLTRSAFPHQRQRHCLSQSSMCSLWATIVARFLGLMSIFTLAKTKTIPGLRINTHLQKTRAVNWWSGNLSRQNQSEPVCKPLPIGQGHAFTEIRGKHSGFDYLQPTELDFYRNKYLSQLICTLL